ncbi:site-specific DNA-methyltransferase [Curtobacterium albidum]|uniref:DNA methyltransferase n=1 Tax=Curtobacterium citreum TaxID=2036 RepID=UPI002026E61C|nr:DNA methyltransferase [Curtobacterium albidum]MCL9665409.1 site-specific DNA-methyltransferase [Curtobacterium albidum]
MLDEAKPEVDPRNSLNALTAKEWLSESVSVWNQKGLGSNHAAAQIEKLHPAPYSYTDVARIIKMLSKPGDLVLDPFVGVGSTLKAAALEGRRGIGFELYPDFAKLAELRLQREVPTDALVDSPQAVLQGDSRTLAKRLDPGTVSLIVTSPPYWSILNKKADHKQKQTREAHGLVTNYGDDERDLGNIEDYDEFIQVLGQTLRDASVGLKHKGYLVLIVGDFRHKSKYYMFHADIARAMEEHGFTLQAMNVLYQRHKRVFPYGYPFAYVPNVHHQNIVIMRKL